jgi:amino acid adenylation domain-containing protein/non-ribosomal peptide synthase protein (TIGR01720 family)
VAYVVGAGGEDLRGYLHARLPEYMVPVAIVDLSVLPLTGSGKVDRAALPAPDWSGGAREGFEAPRTESERLLAGIWGALLKAERVGVRDNFFELGGDSILSIQLVARAARAGCQITPQQVFEHPTLADLAAVAGLVEASRIDQGPVSGPLPLTPIQRWFLESDPVDPHHFNQSVLLQVEAGLRDFWVESAWTALLRHHDALRMRFERGTKDGRHWRQWNRGLEGLERSWARVDLSGLPPGSPVSALAGAAGRAQSSLNLATGPLARGVWFDLPGGEMRLLLVVHHLVVDAVSWRVLLEDLSTACGQLAKGAAVSLPAKTTSYRDWAERLAEHAAGLELGTMEAELDWWRHESGASAVALPVDFPGGRNSGAEARRVSVALSAEETQSLLQEVPAVYRTRIDDLLLTALARSLAGPGEALRVHLEGHGREAIASGMGGMYGVDLSRTVGWFTSLYPVLVEAGGSDVGAALQSVKEHLRSIPGRGMGWGLLRFLRPEIGATLEASLPEISFNYLGQLDAALPAGSLFAAATEDAGPNSSARVARNHLLDVGGAVSGGRLRVSWVYSEGLHRRSTIEAWAERFLSSLRELIAHCLSRSRRRLGGYTPTDFPLAKLGQSELDRLLGGEWGIEDVYPLSPLQEGLLFETLLAPGSGVYVGQILCRLAGGLDEEALEAACRWTLDRHPILRTSFRAEDQGRLVQVVHGRMGTGLEQLDWLGLPAAERERQLAALRSADRERGFDPTRAPLMRWTLARTAEDEHWLLWTHHHLLLDGWSLSAVAGEFLAAYRALRAGELPWAVRRRPYRDYIAWLEGRDLGETEGYWRRTLSGWREPTPLVDGQGRGQGHGRENRGLAEALTASLERQARRHQLTLNTLVQGAWGLLLGRWTGVDDVVFGATVSGRPAELPGVEEMVGLFINTLPVRLRLAAGTAEPRLLGWLRELQRGQVELRQHEHSPLPRVHSWSEVPRGRALFETILAFESYPVDESMRQRGGGEGGLGVAEVRVAEQPHYPLSLSALPGEALALGIDYDRARFDVASVGRMLAHLETLLGGMARLPEEGGEAGLSALPLLGAAERQQLLEWSGGAVAYPREATLHGLFAAQVTVRPDATALVASTGSLSYRELAWGAARLARRLRSLGVGPEVAVGVCLERSAALVTALLGILVAGGAYVPLDPSHPRERLAFLLADTAAPVVVTEEHLLGELPETAAAVLCLGEEAGERGSGEEADRSSAEVSASGLAYVMYTSGSTGTPKGVAVTHRSVVRLVRETDYVELGAADRVAHLANPAFDAATFEIWGALANGGTLVMFERETVLSPERFARHLAERAVTALFLTTALFNQLAREVPAAFGSASHLLFGGEAVDVTAVRRVLAAGPPSRLVHVYGPTENTTFSTWFHVESLAAGATVPIGSAINNSTVHVFDREANPVAVGVAGELYVGGDGLARGYLGRPELTAELFLPRPLGRAGERLYRTGDLVRWSGSGAIEFLGRIDGQAKIRGFRIEPGEIEAVLLTHPAVAAAAVVVRRDASDDPRLVAYVVARLAQPGEEATSGPALRSFLGTRLPAYMVPTSMVLLAALPLTSNGKVDRRALAELDPQAEGSGEAVYVAPRTPVEELVSAIWEDVLAVDRVGAEDNFFALGGHSLLATRVISRVRQAFGVDLALRSLFEATTVATFAQQVESALAAMSAMLAMPAMSGQGRQAPPLQSVNRERALPLSFAQERLWLIDRLQPGSAAYNLPVALRLYGELDLAALDTTFSELVRRHESLRTTFRAVDGEPVQEIHPPVPQALPRVDLADLSSERREGEVRRLAREEARRPFDLASGPLLRLTLLRLRGGEHVALVTQHHIVSDGWSMGVLVRELGSLYTDFHARRPSHLAEPSLQYADFAVWQRAWLSGGELAAQLEYWRLRLAGAPELLELPFDRPRAVAAGVASGSGDRAGRLRRPLPAVLSQGLRQLGRRRGGEATLFMVLLTGWSAFLSRVSGQEDVVVGTPIANRTYREIEGLIGFFVNTLALRTDLTGDPAFTALLGRVRQTTLADYTHQDLPFERLVGELAAERSLSHSPVFQVLFVLQNAGTGMLKLPGLTLEPLPVAAEVAKLDLSLQLSETATGLACDWEYRVSLLDGATVARLAAAFETLLAGAVERPEARLSELPLLGAAEWQQLLEWSGGAVAYPREATIHELFAHQVGLSPDAVAIVFAVEHLSYGALADRAARLARRIRARGVAAGARIGLCLDRSLERIVATVAVLEAGCAYVPLDPSYPRERLSFLVGDSAASLLLTEEKWRPVLPENGVDVLCLDRSERPEPSASPRRAALPAVPAGALAYVLYTSGSTGVPKGVAVPHRGVVRLVRGADYAVFGADEVFLQLAPYSFDAATLEIWGALLHGGRLVIPPPGELSLAEVGALLERHGITTLWLTAGLFHQMVELALPALSGLRQLLAGGDVLSPAQVAKVVADLPGTRLINGYGPTENTTFTCCFPVGSRVDLTRPLPVGRPIANTRVYLLDRHLAPVPLGVAGELAVGGDGLAWGYLGRPDLTAERFLPDPFFGGEGGERLYRTGDLARFDGTGQVEFLGRIDAQVKIRGFRIEPGEIEAALSTHPAVEAAAVVVRRDLGDDRRLVAYLAARAGQEPPGGPTLRAFLGERLPAYMVPAAFVPLAALPLTPNGKVDRPALLRLARLESGNEEAYVAPRTPAEELLAAIWEEVLARERVGIEDDFFSLGGHSLLATRVISRVSWAFGVDLPLRSLFETPTVATFARQVEAALAGMAGGPGRQAPPLLPAERPREIPLSFAQERLWFLDQLAPGSVAYNIPMPVRLSGRLEPAVLAAVFAEIVRRHEVLRTAYPILLGRPVQTITAPGIFVLPQVDLAALPGEAREAESARLAAADASLPFDLARGPVIRATLLALSASPATGEHVLLLAMHHIAFDGWSVGVLIREMATLYTDLAAGRPGRLPELPVQYADFALWQRGWMAGEVLAGELAHWRERLSGAPEVLDLPLDRLRPAVRTFRGERRSGSLPAGAAAALTALSRRSGATLFMTLLAAWKALLVRHGSQLDVVVGTPIANRTHREVEGLIGFFVNTLVLRTSLAGRPGFTALLARVRETALAAYTHQDLPFEKLVAELAPERRTDHTPLFQVMFVLNERAAGPPTFVELPGLRMSGVDSDGEVVKFDLTLIARVDRDGFDLRLGYNSALFFPSTIDRLLGHLVSLVEGVTTAPDRPLDELPLLSEAERHQLRMGWNDTVGEVAGSACLHELFEAQAGERPDAVALVAGETALSYRELLSRAARLADHLAALGIGPEERVGIYLPRSFELLVALLGVLKAGAAYVPIDPANPRERVLFLLADSRVPVLLSSSRLAGDLGPVLAERGTRVVGVDEPGDGAVRQVRGLRRALGADGLAYVIYTSGSTGTPNGVSVPHRSAVNLLRQARDLYRVGPESRVLQIASPGFDASVLEIFLALGAGASLCLAGEEERLAPAALAATLERQGVTTAVLTPSLLSVLVEPSLRAVSAISVGGEACSGELAARWAPGRRLLNCYGPTEAAIFSTVELCREDGETPPIGRPVAGVVAHVVDPSLRLVASGVAGELALGGLGLARGYLDRPSRTAERFIPDPWSGQPGARLYRTGDLARRRPDGRLVFLGRIDDQVKVRGFRVELGEIEVALTAHPEVDLAVVLAPTDGRGERRLVAYVSAGPTGTATVAELRGFLAERLPPYMVPVEIHRLSALPVTTGGKVDRGALARLGDSLRDASREMAGQVLPRDPAERFVAAIWEEVLGRPAIGADESFFELGGSSIQAAILTNLLQARLGEHVYVVALFDAPTVAQLARYLVRHYPRAMARVTGVAAGDAAGSPGSRVDAAAVRRLRAVIPPVLLPPGDRGARNRRAVFILSPPRSGSTLLRVMLAGNPDLFAPPELELLGFGTLAEREAAFAGRSALWREGLIRATMEALGEDADAARRRLEERARQGTTTREAYGELQSWIGRRMLVDKTPSYALDPGTLARAESEFESPLYIHLLRHPCGMIASFEKAKLEQVFFRHPHNFSSRELAELIWLVSQENIREFLSGVPGERQHQVRFEDLVRSPREELSRLSAFLKLPFVEAMLDPYADGSRKMTNGIHALSKMVGDVKFHEHRQVDARVAESWRSDHPEERLGEPTVQLAEEIGYFARRPGFHCLVPLAAGPATDSAEPALFLFHPIGGNVFCYRELARLLGEARPVYGLQSLGLGNGIPPQETVRQMSASYLAAVRRAQPRGPYHLAGWSIGGVLAWETAQQLQAAGEEVGLLALIDSRVPEAGEGQEPDEALLLLGLSHDLSGFTEREPMVSLERLRELGGEAGFEEILRLARRAGALPSDFDDDAARLWRVYRSNVLAVRAYVPRPYHGPLALFAARRNPLLASLGPTLGWERLGGPILASHLFEADHYSLLRAPAVGPLAEAVQECLLESRAVGVEDSTVSSPESV